jgi:hypothetical protein
MSRMKYTPRAVSDYLELNDDGQENEGGNNRASNTLWIKDLELQHGANKCVFLSDVGDTRLMADIACRSSRRVHRLSSV